MQINKLVLGAYQENCYVVVDEDSKDALIIDPGDEAEELVKHLRKMNINLKYILLTHGHVDPCRSCRCGSGCPLTFRCIFQKRI